MQATSNIGALLGQTSTEVKGTGGDQMDQDAFLKLMVAQLKNQDPTKPMDSSQFLAQLSQMTMVSGIQELQDSFASMAGSMQSSQALEATSLIGKQVLTPSNTALVTETQALEGVFNLPQNSSNATLNYYDINGALVDSRALGPQSAGQHNFSWNGVSSDGRILPAGTYRVAVEATIGGDKVPVSARTYNTVQSVSVDRSTNSIELNLAGGATANLSQVTVFK